jgi:DNA-binding beta-propeller fold protein YncE
MKHPGIHNNSLVPRRRSLVGISATRLHRSGLFWRRQLIAALVGVFALSIPALVAVDAQDAGPAGMIGGKDTVTAKSITPSAARGALFQELNPRLAVAPERRAGYAGAMAASPNGKRLAIQTSGFPAYADAAGKLIPEASMEYVFLFDITASPAVQLQVLALPNTFPGLVWSPASDRLFVSGGKDDAVVEFVDDGAHFATGRTIRLGHKSCLGVEPVPAGCGPVAGALAVSPDGKRLLVANIQNDSVSLIDLTTGKVVAEQDLRPGLIDPRRHGEPGGSFPRAVTWVSADRAYVASVRDREVLSLSVGHDKVRVKQRLHVEGQPAALLASRSGSRLYVALDMTGQVAVFDTRRDRLIEKFNAVAPASVYDDRKLLGGANTNALALLPDERTLLVSNGGQNSVAVVRLSGHARDVAAEAARGNRRQPRAGDADDEKEAQNNSMTVGLVPTGWYPTGVATASDGKTWYIVNGKSPLGPNPPPSQSMDPVSWRAGGQFSWEAPTFKTNGSSALLGRNAYVTQLERAGFLTMPAPDGLELARLTKQVAHNNRFDQPEQTEADARLFSFLREHIKHVIYVMKENRTYDQVLGDLEVGNGDPRLTLFPERLSPNHHAIARNFVTLDNLSVSAEGSMTGVYWTFAGQTNDLLERTDPLTLATGFKGESGGFPYGSNRNVNIGYPTAKERHAADSKCTPTPGTGRACREALASDAGDPDILPGSHSVYDVDGPGGEAGTGYLWNGALRAGLPVRSYGVFARVYNLVHPNLELFSIDGRAVSPQSIAAYEDPNWPVPEWVKPIPDFYRVREWQREFEEFSRKGSAPSLMVMYLWEDHFGHFDEALDGVDTPETQMADNDYSIGMMVETVAKSPFAKDTLFIVIEDDTTDGPDHVDAERTVALFAGPYIRQHAVVSKHYSTVSIVKTIESVLGIQPVSLNDALAAPMSDIFDPNQEKWGYEAIVPKVLRSTQLPLPPDAHATIEYPAHPAAYWVKAFARQDFSGPDRLDPNTFNRALWRGLKGDSAYPVVNRSRGWSDTR